MHQGDGGAGWGAMQSGTWLYIDIGIQCICIFLGYSVLHYIYLQQYFKKSYILVTRIGTLLEMTDQRTLLQNWRWKSLYIAVLYLYTFII